MLQKLITTALWQKLKSMIPTFAVLFEKHVKEMSLMVPDLEDMAAPVA
jgi:hypothetical protein